jgi:hypothetical protein
MKITGSRFVQKWAEALGVEPNETARIVIDARPGEVLRVYVEKFGTERMLHIDPPDPQSVTVEVL